MLVNYAKRLLKHSANNNQLLLLKISEMILLMVQLTKWQKVEI